MNDEEAKRQYDRLRTYASQLGVYEHSEIHAGLWYLQTKKLEIKFYLVAGPDRHWRVSTKLRGDLWWPGGHNNATKAYALVLRESRGLCGIHD